MLFREVEPKLAAFSQFWWGDIFNVRFYSTFDFRLSFLPLNFYPISHKFTPSATKGSEKIQHQQKNQSQSNSKSKSKTKIKPKIKPTPHQNWR